MQKNLKKLAELLQNSSLSNEDKKRILNHLPFLSFEEIENLKKVLSYEKDQLKKINDNFLIEVEKLNIDLDQLMKSAVPKIRKKLEDKDRKKEIKQADDLLDQARSAG